MTDNDINTLSIVRQIKTAIVVNFNCAGTGLFIYYDDRQTYNCNQIEPNIKHPPSW